MKVLQVQITDQVASELETLVKSGWFVDEAEIARLALVEFALRGHHRFELIEQFQRQDIAWAVQQKDSGA